MACLGRAPSRLHTCQLPSCFPSIAFSICCFRSSFQFFSYAFAQRPSCFISILFWASLNCFNHLGLTTELNVSILLFQTFSDLFLPSVTKSSSSASFLAFLSLVVCTLCLTDSLIFYFSSVAFRSLFSLLTSLFDSLTSFSLPLEYFSIIFFF